jgi:hypothetical protein
LPDGLFSDQKSRFWSFFVGLGMENLGIFTAILVLLGTFGVFCVNLVHFVLTGYIFSRFGMLHQEVSGNPGPLQSLPYFRDN